MDVSCYKILGLQPEAGLDEVKHRYDMLMKRSLRDESLDAEGITKAYDKIIAENTVDYFNPDAELLHTKGINKKKVKNYIFQNKIKLGILVWALICILLFLYIIIFKAGDIGLIPDTVPF